MRFNIAERISLWVMFALGCADVASETPSGAVFAFAVQLFCLAFAVLFIFMTNPILALKVTKRHLESQMTKWQ